MKLEKSDNLFDLAANMKRDVSVVSRRLTKLSKETELLNKNGGSWTLTSKGIELVTWAKRAILEQQNVLMVSHKIKIATTREFSSRILIPHLKDLKNDFKNIEIITTEGQSEELLLSKRADLAIDCGTPMHPDIRFKKIAKERMVFCSSKLFAQKSKFVLKGDDYLHFTRNNITELQEELKLKLEPNLSFADLSSLLSAITENLGFGYLPYYVIADLVKNNKAHIYPVSLGRFESFGVWHHHDFNDSKTIKIFEQLLRQIKLD
jgi:DNA-binding transcriptional LysR family regulator